MTKPKPTAPTSARAHIHDDDDGISLSRSTRESSSSSSSGQPQTAEELITALTNLGFDSAYAFVIKHGFNRVNAALALDKLQPGLVDLPGCLHSPILRRPAPRAVCQRISRTSDSIETSLVRKP